MDTPLVLLMDTPDRIRAICRTDRWTGAYVLHIRYDKPARLTVGRINGGRPLDIAAGRYLYTGSAMGTNRGLHLPRRLVRHATRTGAQPPHPCRPALLAHFRNAGLSGELLLPRLPKRLFWNIDHLLEPADAHILDIFYIRSDRRAEFAIAERLEARTDTNAPIPGLGAHDHAGHSHFLAIAGGPHTWGDCCADLERLLNGIT